LQLADTLRAAISSGELAAGAKLPSGRALARTYRVAVATAQKAVDELQREGLVRSHGTRGVYVVPGAPESVGSEVSALRDEVASLAARVAALESKLDGQS
jgi:GntR family transcriptional regulator